MPPADPQTPIEENRPDPNRPLGPRRTRRLTAKHRRRRTIVALVVAAVLALPVAGFALVNGLQSNISSSQLNADGRKAPEKTTGEMNVLIIGSDTRDLGKDGVAGVRSGFGAAAGQRSDSLILAHIAADGSRIDALQIPRDTETDLPACSDTGSGTLPGGRGMINSALAAGPACSVSAVEALTGVRIDHFIEVNFAGFATIVDAMGGIDVDLPTALTDSKAKLDLPAGRQHLGGADALALARTRHAVGDGSDISRLNHQQMVMTAIIDRAKSGEVLSRPDRLYAFLHAVTSSLQVDDGLDSVTSLASLATTVSSVPKGAITFAVMPWGTPPGEPNRVMKSDGADAVFTAIRADHPITGLVKDSGATRK